MDILLACEESQATTIEMRRLGHRAFSCDIQECSGGHPEWHIMGDVLPLLDGRCEFTTMDGTAHKVVGKWDMIIAHPPCTYFSTAGANWLWRGGQLNQERYENGLEAKHLFMSIYNADCDRIAIENPVPMKIWELPDFQQEIQPYHFGDPFLKKTRLWLKGLPKLQHTNVVEPIAKWVSCGNSGNREKQNRAICKSSSSNRKRSATFPGIARAFADQWAGENKSLEG